MIQLLIEAMLFTLLVGGLLLPLMLAVILGVAVWWHLTGSVVGASPPSR